ncbi:MAG: hypothetical protein COW18_03805 [Zetaproteobacteria bacterium CG12_big_fil_rev_8_21_14_0_65_54_13]|nr:MAG: hypothetical protein COX55_02455 [Zetaproteobacteria bacterium CG23_combo_of_CG06-09_8_20_14_all_54_7]PIW50300.1 MAG: hypothetical protein COW18_03805 [Zetaproteobacteria bacterium CG12_big_fil_rev_8_21_14_0_65_54_13]PIX53269.1 MAG: hypothetical protein COZ50_14165 [Zetaproteobacteria bacterium CG_4_10_14_3_um_filter_54_28]PJA31013.1 MAG: hypothetical protein CO188_01015 [Zetaproteobacteria bacterium CG_4_9_14_3_um_filter_54_145]
MAIHEAITTYLDAVEKKYGADARKHTEVKHRGGTTFVLKQAESLHAQIVDLGRLNQMSKHLQNHA